MTEKTFVKPELKHVEGYMRASDFHCHEVKSECSPYQAK